MSNIHSLVPIPFNIPDVERSKNQKDTVYDMTQRDVYTEFLRFRNTIKGYLEYIYDAQSPRHRVTVKKEGTDDIRTKPLRDGICLTDRANVVISALTLMDAYIRRAKYRGVAKEVEKFLLTTMLVCFWIVEKWEFDDCSTAKSIAVLHNKHVRYPDSICEIEVDLLRVLHFRICKYMPGLHPCNYRHKNTLRPVMDELLQTSERI